MIYKCEYCGKEHGPGKFAQQDLQRHIQSKHRIEKTECHICKGQFDKSYLKKHVMTVHEGKRDQIHKCMHCGKEYVHKYRLKTHIKREHDNVRDEQCNQCGKLFFSNDALKKHLRNRHSIIAVKTKKSNSITKSKSHIKPNHDNSNVRKEQCNQCGKLFFKKYLEKHIRTVHEGKRDQIHKCEHCGKEYVHNLRLRIHIKRDHDNIRDEECDQCGKLFSCTETLKEHTKKVHNKGNQKFFHEKNNFEFANVRDHFTKVNK